MNPVEGQAERSAVSEGDPVIAVSGLAKHYGAFEAVRGVDLEVRRGEIFALLGPNGAGKTTVVEILEGFRKRSAGEVSVLDVDPAHADGVWRDRIGVVLQESEPDPGLSVGECLDLYAGYYRNPRPPEEIVELVGLRQSIDTQTERLSGGQRRRLDVGLALIGDPELLFLDEPTTGFDPAARRAAWQMIDGLRRLGKTVLLTTHYMDEAERLADRIAVIAAGLIVAEGTSETIGGRDRTAARISFTLPAGLTGAELPEGFAAGAEGRGQSVVLETTSSLADLKRLADWALTRGLDLPDLELRRASLEDVYLTLTGEQAAQE